MLPRRRADGVRGCRGRHAVLRPQRLPDRIGPAAGTGRYRDGRRVPFLRPSRMATRAGARDRVGRVDGRRRRSGRSTRRHRRLAPDPHLRRELGPLDGRRDGLMESRVVPFDRGAVLRARADRPGGAHSGHSPAEQGTDRDLGRRADRRHPHPSRRCGHRRL